MARERKKKEGVPKAGCALYMLTYGDMVTLLMTFFVIMLSSANIEGYKVRIMLSAFTGMGMFTGGNTLSEGKLAELGNTIEALPSLDSGRSLADDRRRAISAFEPEISAGKLKVKTEERGLIISLVGDAMFDRKSAEVKIENSRDMLKKVAGLIRNMDDRKIRIEGHTDNIKPTESDEYKSNWDLSAARSINVLKYLVDYNCNEQNFQVCGFADTIPLKDNSTEEGRAYNRRVDIVILSDGHMNTKYSKK